MSPLEHTQWSYKLAQIDVPVDLYVSKYREMMLRVASYAVVPFFSPLYVLATHTRRVKMSNELARNELYPNTRTFRVKGLAGL